MFDFFLITKFNTKPLTNTGYSFLKNGYYKEIDAEEYRKPMENSFVCYLERAAEERNYHKSGDLHIFTYGSLFTNNLHRDKTSEAPRRIYARDVAAFFHQDPWEFYKFIKGSFVIVIHNDKNRETIIVTDRMNVLPLYFCFKDNTLIISSSIRMIMETGIPSNTLNHQALTEQLIFDYVLGSKTFFKDIEAVPPATKLTFSKFGKAEKQYWNVTKLYQENHLSRKDSLEMLAEQLHQNVQLYTSDSEKILVAFTGGYDGRTNVAMLDRSPEDFLCYSFGMAKSKQITIPQGISEKMGLTYRPIPLQQEFEQQYENLANEVVEFSNGTAPIIRANYPYAFKKLKHFSTTALTGLFGSEILRPIHNLGIMMNDYSENIFLSENSEQAFRQTIEAVKNKKYLQDSIIENSADSLYNEINHRFIEKYQSYGKLTGMFFFLLEEGVRKYFMQELQHERPYVTNRFPYFDDDLIDLIYKTPFAGMYNGFMGKSKVKRRNAQLLYAHILRKYKPELGKYEVDRGYNPDDLLKITPINYIYLLKGVIKTKLYLRKHGDDAFKSEVWAKDTIKNTLARKTDAQGIFNSGLESAFNSGSFTNDMLTYTHMISLVKYFDGL
jgi:asparagine synthetase B (glutamine-hydrolysing)